MSTARLRRSGGAARRRRERRSDRVTINFRGQRVDRLTPNALVRLGVCQ